MISKWIVPGYSIRNSCNVIFVYMFLLHPFNFLQDQLNPKRRMWRSLKHGLRLSLDISWYNVLKSEIELSKLFCLDDNRTTRGWHVTNCSPFGKCVTQMPQGGTSFFSRSGGTSCRRRRSLVLVLSSSPSICRARREPLGQGERWRRWGRS